MTLKRRAFLRQTGLALTALGFSDLSLSGLTGRYQHALAQPSRRKLALLVGINQYPEQVCDCTVSRGNALQGCLTDVELQRELLIGRFGFQASDILTLTDQQATRSAIESAFLSHLTAQARPGDIVLFHFSGFGSQFQLSDTFDTVANSLVPVDGFLPTEDAPFIQDLPEDTLGLLLRSLSTEQIITVLDTSYSPPESKTFHSNLRMRSRPNPPSGQLAEAERVFQDTLLIQTQTTKAQINTQWQSGQLPGLVLKAARSKQIAVECQWSGFSAGLFTYNLTQQLWWATPATTLRVNLSRANKTINQMIGVEQQPDLSGQKARDQRLLPYFLTPEPLSGADGVVKKLDEDGQSAQIWLAGLPTLVLEHYGVSSIVSLCPTPSSLATSSTVSPDASDAATGTFPDDAIFLQVRSRDGLTVKARLCCTSPKPNAIQVGQLVQEFSRILPRNIGLIIGLDTSLARIERVDATSAFAAIPRVSAVIAGEQPADYLFGKTQPPAQALAVSLLPNPTASDETVQAFAPVPPPSHDSYGLFNLGRTVIPGSLTADSEAVKTAINRITPKLQTLLANKLLRLTANQGSSRLGVRATLEMVAPQERIVAQQETMRAAELLPQGKLAALFVGDGTLPTLPIGSRIRYRLQNYSDRPIYFILLGLESNGNAIALQPPAQTANEPSEAQPWGAIAAADTLIIPQTLTPSEWTIHPPEGLVETHLIFSSAPFDETLAVLRAATSPADSLYRLTSLLNPLDVAQSVLQDLHHASSSLNQLEIPADTYSLNVNAWATLSFQYKVISS